MQCIIDRRVLQSVGNLTTLLGMGKYGQGVRQVPYPQPNYISISILTTDTILYHLQN